MKKAMLFLAFATLASPAAAARAKIEQNSKALEFDYSWPAEAASIGPLDRRFRDDARTALRRALKDATDDMKLAASQKREYHQHVFSRSWEVAGQSQRLLSLEGSLGTFTGGAHPNSTNDALLWERRLGREVKFDSLFLRQRAFAGADPLALLQEARRRASQAAAG